MKKRWIFVLLLVAVAAGVTVVAGWPQPTVTVKTATLTPQLVEQTVTCTGAVEAAESTGVFAPISCVLRDVAVAEGQRVQKGDVLATVDREATRAMLSDPAQLMVLAAMPEELTAPEDGIVVQVKATPGTVLEMGVPCAVLALLETGMPVRVTGDGFQKDAYAGTLTEIASAARSGSSSGTVVEGVVTLKAGEIDPSLRLGLTAKAAIVTSVTDGGVVVPYEAVLTEEEQSYVYVLEDGCARRRNIRVQSQLAQGVLLADGDLSGARVIAQPGRIDRDGMAVVAAEDTP